MNKISLLLVLFFGVCQLQAQKKKGYEPIFEIPGRTAASSGLSMHDKYMGKVVFSNQQLTRENTAESLFKSSFDLASPIYARVFTSNAVQNYMLYNKALGLNKASAHENTGYNYTCIYYIDGVNVLDYNKDNSSGQLFNTSSWQLLVYIPNKDSDWKTIRNALNALSPGTHKVRVEIWAGKSDIASKDENINTSFKPIAEGEFDLLISNDSKIKIGKKWSDIAEGKADPKIKPELVKLFSEWLKNDYSQYTIHSYKLFQDDYGVQRDDYGLIKYRYMTIGAQATDKNGKCFSLSALYTQDYMGGGKYSTVFKQFGTYAQSQELDCE